jgi:photosystem II stability/assembly factor-like uncharacterized protein
MSREIVYKLFLYFFLIVVIYSIFVVQVEILYSEEDYAEEIIFDPSKIMWIQTNGPPGSKMFKLIQNPQHHNELYVLSVHGIYKSIDKGETWEFMDEFKNIEISTIAVYEDKLFVCGNGDIYFYNIEGNLTKILEGFWNDIFVCDDKLFVVSGGRKEVSIMYANLTSEDYVWKDISPSESDLDDLVSPSDDSDFWFGIMVRHIVVVDDRILVNIVLEVEGSGEYTNGLLYISDDFGGSWSKANLNVQSGLIISNIIQDIKNEEHIILSFRHKLHDTYLPLSELLFESYDASFTWSDIVNITLEANHVGDIDLVDSSYYITPAKGSSIVKVDGADYELIDMPRAEGYDPKIEFKLVEILFDLDDQQIVYGRTNWALGLVKSEDGMQTWRKIDGDIIASDVSIVAVHPYYPDIIFASGNLGREAYYTKDGGESWQPFSHITFGDELKYDPHDTDRIILIDENSQIYESLDLGETWNNINHNFSSARVFDFEISSDGNRIYVSNLGVGLSTVDTTEELLWGYMLGSPDYVYDFEIDLEDSNILYASYSPKIFENHSSVWRYSLYQTENDGWSEILRVENTSGVTALELDKSNPNNLYVGIVGEKGMIYSSDNKGDNWQRLNEHFTFVTIHEIAVDPKNENIVYVAPWGGGLFKSTDNSDVWIELKAPTISVASIVVDPNDSNHIIIGDRMKPQIFESFDQGESWSELVVLDEEFYYRISSMIIYKGELYFSVFNRIEGFISLFTEEPMSGTVFRLEGENLIQVSGEIKRSVLSFYSDNDELYAICHVKGVYKLVDGEWRSISSSLYEIGFNNVIIVDDEIYVAGGCDIDLRGRRRIGDDTVVNEIYKSMDNGETWTPLLGNNLFSSGIKKLLNHPSEMNVFFAGTGTGIYVSTDRGLTWSEENDGLDFKNIGSMVVGEEYIYVGTLGGGVYSGIINSDYSIDWLNSTGPYPTIYNIQIRVDPLNSSIIYASSYPGGVFKSKDQGRTWIESNFALPSFEVIDPRLQGYYSLEIDKNNTNILYLGVFGKGVYKSVDGAAVWIPMYGNIGQNMEIMNSGITQIKVDPTNSNNIYLATSNGVYFSNDASENWVEMNNGLGTLDIKSLRVTSITQPPFMEDFEEFNIDRWQLEDWFLIEENDNMVLQGVGHSWATSGLESWTDYEFDFKLKLMQGRIHLNFRIQPEEGRYFLGFHPNGLYLQKQFNQWSEFVELIDYVEIFNENQWYNFKIELKEDLIKVYMDGELKIEFRDSEPLLNGKIGFESFDESQVFIDDINVTLYPTSEVYVGTGGYGIYKFDNSIGKWQNLDRTLGIGWWHIWDRRMYQFCSLLFDPLKPGKMYLGVFPSGFFVSEDNGYSWRDSSLGLGNDGIFSLTFHPYNPNILWAGTYNGLAKTVDGGNTWELKTNGWPPEQWPYNILINDENPDIMYSTSKNGQNKGFCHRNTFCGVVMKTVDGGENWFYIMNGLDNRSEFYSILFHPLDNEILFMSTNKGVYVSINSGQNWTSINQGLSTTWNQVRDNVADNLALTQDGKYLVLGTMGYGVWKADLTNTTIINKIPKASFTQSPEQPTTQDKVSFQDTSEDPDSLLTSWEWDFGDGSSSTKQNPIHTYTEAGTYTVVLKVVDDKGSIDILSKSLVIEIGQSSIYDYSIIIIGIAVCIIVLLGLIIIKK